MNGLPLQSRIRAILAVTEKDLKIAFRFPKNFVASQLIHPLRLFALFWLVYKSFFVATNNHELGTWTRGNYVPTLLLGSIFYSSFSYAYYRFRTAFLSEKYWKTIQVILTAPLSKFDFLVGSTLALIIELLLPILAYLMLFQLFYPISLVSLFLLLGILFLMLFGVLGFGLIQGVFSISNENYLFIFDYFHAAWGLFSCFYFTKGVLPAAFRFLAEVNPVYHAMELSRGIVFGHLPVAAVMGSALYLIFFSISAPLLGAFIFRNVVREMGVRGF